MEPPWSAFPRIPFGSIGWRMGPGEDYWVAFSRYYERKTPEHRKRYAAENPEPSGWEGFYAVMDSVLHRRDAD